MRKRFAFAFAAALTVPFLTLAACTTGNLTAKGGACFQSIDCQSKLVCIYPTGSDAGTCTDDLTGIVDVPDAATSDTAVPDAVVTDQVAPQDTNVPETTPPQDTGAPETSTNDASGD